MNQFDQNFWNSRWENGETGWDIGEASSPIAEYFLQVEDKEITAAAGGGAVEVTVSGKKEVTKVNTVLWHSLFYKERRGGCSMSKLAV